ncbi:hypothetical protein BGX26_007853 [Mortierella sp. AD094]|nr:hypothetical protein BGX26_007853 [Mortierella sp. AD094]
MAIVAVAASVTTATVILGYQGSQRRQRAKQLKDDCRLFSHPISEKSNRPDSSGATEGIVRSSTVAPGAQQKRENTKIEFDEELVLEQLARNIAFLGEEGVQKLRNSFVVVVGAGGIGSWAASMLIKSGVGRIRIIDFDQVTLSELNQHATASRADIGTPKAIAMKQYFRTIAPWVEVDARVESLQKDSAERLLSGNPDYVVDAIGNLTSKVQLLKYCCDHKIPVMSSMEAGAKADPSRVQISDISETFEDPLARAVRRRLKKVGIDTGIEVVFSTEKPHRARPSDQDAAQSGHSAQGSLDYRPLPNYQSSLLPVLGPLPAMFGMSMATFITCKIAGWAMDPFPVKFRMELYQRLHRDLKAQEESLYPGSGDMKLDRRDIGYVVEEMFRGKSAISQSMDRVAVCRWKRDLPLSLLNVVVMTEKEMERHLALPMDANLEMVYGKDVVEYVEGQYREEELINNL